AKPSTARSTGAGRATNTASAAAAPAPASAARTGGDAGVDTTALNAELAELRKLNSELRNSLSTVEKERDFYYEKLVSANKAPLSLMSLLQLLLIIDGG